MTKPGVASGWIERREAMVARQIENRGIHDPRVLAAMRSIPRELFVPPENRHLSYGDEPVSIGYGQTISQPYITALMAECLELAGTETVLEVGAGCGYHAAVLGALAARVVTVEIVPELAEIARANLLAAGLGANVEAVCGDASLGWPEQAPYNAISVAAAAPEPPPQLLAQLTDPGTMVIPIGSYWEQELRVITKSLDKIHSRLATYCRLVPLRGPGGWT